MRWRLSLPAGVLKGRGAISLSLVLLGALCLQILESLRAMRY